MSQPNKKAHIASAGRIMDTTSPLVEYHYFPFNSPTAVVDTRLCIVNRTDREVEGALRVNVPGDVFDVKYLLEPGEIRSIASVLRNDELVEINILHLTGPTQVA